MVTDEKIQKWIESIEASFKLGYITRNEYLELKQRYEQLVKTRASLAAIKQQMAENALKGEQSVRDEKNTENS